MACNHERYQEINKFDKATFYQCDECKLIFTEKYWQDLDRKVLYEQYYRNEIVGRFNFGIEYIIRLFRFFRAFKIFTVYPRAKRILDIGSGRGFTLFYLKKYYKFVRTAGTQISKRAYEFSKNRLGLEIYNHDLLELSLEDSSFDIVTLWETLEHIAKAEKYIEKIRVLLRESGRLVIEVPNFNSWTRRFTKQYWLGLDTDFHINFFTPESLSSILAKHGFGIKLIHTFSLEYSIFISAQSIISAITKTEHLIFQYIQGGRFDRRIIWHAILFILLFPICLAINLILFFSKKGEVLFVVAEKKE